MADGDDIPVAYVRDGQTYECVIDLPEGEQVDIIGVSALTTTYHPSFGEAFTAAVSYVAMVGSSIAQLLMPQHTLEVMSQSSSIVGISAMASEAAASGLADLILFAAAVSVSLGFMNLLPIPPLDGGKILIEVLQLVLRRQLSTRAQNAVSYVGLAFFLFIFAFALRNDIVRILLDRCGDMDEAHAPWRYEARARPDAQVMVGAVAVGGGAPVSVQSMCTTKTADAEATLAQISALPRRVARSFAWPCPTRRPSTPSSASAPESPLPVVADIHFDHRLALAALEAGVDGLRINPGNIGSFERVDAVIDAAGEAGIPIRIGVNAGSLDPKVAERTDLTQPEKLVASSVSFVEHFEARGFTDIVLSAKAHSVPVTIETYRMLSARAAPDSAACGGHRGGHAAAGDRQELRGRGRPARRGHRQHDAPLAHGRPC